MMSVSSDSSGTNSLVRSGKRSKKRCPQGLFLHHQNTCPIHGRSSTDGSTTCTTSTRTMSQYVLASRCLKGWGASKRPWGTIIRPPHFFEHPASATLTREEMKLHINRLAYETLPPRLKRIIQIPEVQPKEVPNAEQRLRMLREKQIQQQQQEQQQQPPVKPTPTIRHDTGHHSIGEYVSISVIEPTPAPSIISRRDSEIDPDIVEGAIQDVTDAETAISQASSDTSLTFGKGTTDSATSFDDVERSLKNAMKNLAAGAPNDVVATKSSQNRRKKKRRKKATEQQDEMETTSNVLPVQLESIKPISAEGVNEVLERRTQRNSPHTSQHIDGSTDTVKKLAFTSKQKHASNFLEQLSQNKPSRMKSLTTNLVAKTVTANKEILYGKKKATSDDVLHKMIIDGYTARKLKEKMGTKGATDDHADSLERILNKYDVGMSEDSKDKILISTGHQPHRKDTLRQELLENIAIRVSQTAVTPVAPNTTEKPRFQVSRHSTLNKMSVKASQSIVKTQDRQRLGVQKHDTHTGGSKTKLNSSRTNVKVATAPGHDKKHMELQRHNTVTTGASHTNIKHRPTAGQDKHHLEAHKHTTGTSHTNLKHATAAGHDKNALEAQKHNASVRASHTNVKAQLTSAKTQAAGHKQLQYGKEHTIAAHSAKKPSLKKKGTELKEDDSMDEMELDHVDRLELDISTPELAHSLDVMVITPQQSHLAFEPADELANWRLMTEAEYQHQKASFHHLHEGTEAKQGEAAGGAQNG